MSRPTGKGQPTHGIVIKIVEFEMYHMDRWQMFQTTATQIDYDGNEAHMLALRDTLHAPTRTVFYNPVRAVRIR